MSAAPTRWPTSRAAVSSRRSSDLRSTATTTTPTTAAATRLPSRDIRPSAPAEQLGGRCRRLLVRATDRRHQRAGRARRLQGQGLRFGPEIAYQFPSKVHPVGVDLRWYHEFGAENRVEGDAVFLTLSVPLSIKPKPVTRARTGRRRGSSSSGPLREEMTMTQYNMSREPHRVAVAAGRSRLARESPDRTGAEGDRRLRSSPPRPQQSGVVGGDQELLALRRAQVSDPVYWGDTHHHTSNSGDGFTAGDRLTPEEAYRFARGEEVVSSTGVPAKLSRPLDFLVISDHAEGLGLMQEVYNGNPAFVSDPTLAQWSKGMKDGGNEAAAAAQTRSHQGPGDGHVARPDQGPEGRRTDHEVRLAAVHGDRREIQRARPLHGDDRLRVDLGAGRQQPAPQRAVP